MPKLIVDDAGTRKAVRLPKGRCVVGSGEGAALRLTAEGVAPRHLEIVNGDAGTEVRVAQDASEVSLGGQRVAPGARAEWKEGAQLVVGAAKLVLQGDGAAAAPASAAPAGAASAATRPGAARAGASGGASGARTSRAGAAGRASGAARGSSRRGAEEKDGRPAWVVPAIVAGVAVIGVVGYLAIFHGKDRGLYYSSDVAGIETQLAAANYTDARKIWEGLAAAKSLTPEQREVVAKLGLRITEGERLSAGGGVAVTQGHKWAATQLEPLRNTVSAAPQPDPAAIRLLHERVEEFRSYFPGHPALANYEAQLASLGAAAIASKPPTMADVEFQEQYLITRVKQPKAYRRVIALCDRFIATASTGPERDAAVAKRAELAHAQSLLTDDLMGQARNHWEKGNERDAMRPLVEAIVFVADEEKAAAAAQVLAGLPNGGRGVVGYMPDRPDIYRVLMAQPAIARAARESGANVP